MKKLQIYLIILHFFCSRISYSQSQHDDFSSGIELNRKEKRILQRKILECLNNNELGGEWRKKHVRRKYIYRPPVEISYTKHELNRFLVFYAIQKRDKQELYIIVDLKDGIIECFDLSYPNNTYWADVIDACVFEEFLNYKM